jgi:glyoxylase-like metal-dependent hydrolase (beta-lactamase superfamily II)
MRKRGWVATLAGVSMFGLMLGACDKTPPPPQNRTADSQPAQAQEEALGEPADPRFIGRIWVSTTPGHSRGSILIFLPDRTLLMDSCFEPFRVAQWGARGDQIRWIEETIPVEATMTMPSADELQLRIAGQERVQSYVTASVPYTCPDMPR